MDTMKLKRIFAVAISLLLTIAILAGCAQGTRMSSLLQLSEVGEGEEIAVMTVRDYGEIKLRFFPEQAPKAVENFTTHVKNGYYNGLAFHRVIQDFMIQGGDPKGDGTGGESIWGEGFGVEAGDQLYHFSGALCMAQSSLPNSIGSQFYIVQSKSTDNIETKMAYSSVKYPELVAEQYRKSGGTPHLDGNYTVFGQVFEGMDIVDKIAACEVVYNSRGERSVPAKSVVIDKIVMTEYQK